MSAFVYGLVTYAALFVLYRVFRQPFEFVDLEAAQDQAVFTARVCVEIIIATFLGFVLAVAWVFASTRKVITHFLQKIGATKKYGDEDVWDFTFNTEGIGSQFINLRDFDRKIVYTGFVRVFSESGKLRELTLYDVKVYDFEGEFMYAMPSVYIARKPEDIHIEFPLA